MGKVAQHVKGMSYFRYYRLGLLYYETDTGLVFTIPVEDTNDASFHAADKSIFFMRWIRKELAQREII